MKRIYSCAKKTGKSVGTGILIGEELKYVNLLAGAFYGISPAARKCCAILPFQGPVAMAWHRLNIVLLALINSLTQIHAVFNCIFCVRNLISGFSVIFSLWKVSCPVL